MLVVQRSVLLVCLVVLSGCSAVGWHPEVSGLESTIVETPEHQVKVWYRITDPQQPLVVYFEGDGRAFITRTRPSTDPTPPRSLVKALMVHDDSPNLLYVPRPCQYIMGDNCSVQDWTLGRYSDEMVQASQVAMAKIGQQHNIKQYRLVGYSGGAAIAVLIAARMPDQITDIRTIAGNLDTEAFTRVHRTTPLLASHNPVDYADGVAQIPQHHFVGTDDKIVPERVVQSFVSTLPEHSDVQLTSMSGVDHGASWIKAWKQIQKTP